jgi:hypothetical protein
VGHQRNSGGMSNEGKFQKTAVVVGTKKKGEPLPPSLSFSFFLPFNRSFCGA